MIKQQAATIIVDSLAQHTVLQLAPVSNLSCGTQGNRDYVIPLFSDHEVVVPVADVFAGGGGVGGAAADVEVIATV